MTTTKGTRGMMNFGQAIEMLKAGKWVRRAGWNGKGMYIYLEAGFPQSYEPFIVMKTAQGKFQPGWLASQADILGEDWEEVFPDEPNESR